MTLKYRDWVFEVDRELTRLNFESVSVSWADNRVYNYCKNYVAYLNKVFSDEIKQLYADLGIAFKKELEITLLEILPDGLHHIGGWFNFKGRLATGQSCRVPIHENTGFTFDMTKVEDNFAIGCADGSDLAHLTFKIGLFQVEFTFIPWTIDKSLETPTDNKII